MGLKKLLVMIRNFIILLKIFQFFSFKAVIISLFREKSLRLCHKLWAKFTFDYLKVKLHELPTEPMRREKTLILANHRSQGDFFIHNVITNYQANFLSRMVVGIIFPFFLTAHQTLWFFNRSGNIDIDKFNSWLDKKWACSPRPHLLAYPEGHRMAGTKTVQREKLKTGMIRYAYRKKVPTQMLMSFGNEQVLNEKKLHLSWDVTIYYSFSRTYDPADYPSEDEFVNDIKDRFTQFFQHVYDQYRKYEPE